MSRKRSQSSGETWKTIAFTCAQRSRIAPKLDNVGGATNQHVDRVHHAHLFERNCSTQHFARLHTSRGMNEIELHTFDCGYDPCARGQVLGTVELMRRTQQPRATFDVNRASTEVDVFACERWADASSRVPGYLSTHKFSA